LARIAAGMRGCMPIQNDAELADAVVTAGQLLQDIHDYAQRVNREDAKVRFPARRNENCG
jgi:hypothetical protein